MACVGQTLGNRPSAADWPRTVSLRPWPAGPAPKLPVAVFRLTDRSTLKAAIAWRPRVAPQSLKLPFDGRLMRVGIACRPNDCSSQPRSGAADPQETVADLDLAPKTAHGIWQVPARDLSACKEGAALLRHLHTLALRACQAYKQLD